MPRRAPRIVALRPVPRARVVRIDRVRRDALFDHRLEPPIARVLVALVDEAWSGINGPSNVTAVNHFRRRVLWLPATTSTSDRRASARGVLSCVMAASSAFGDVCVAWPWFRCTSLWPIARAIRSVVRHERGWRGLWRARDGRRRSQSCARGGSGDRRIVGERNAHRMRIVETIARVDIAPVVVGGR